MTRRAVVTGGSRGIGRAVAARLLDAGHEVTITGRDREALEAAAAALRARGSVDAAVLDVTDADAVAAFFEGRTVDILVNNAGAELSAPLHRTSLEDWQRIMAVNATGVFLCTRAVIEGMRARGWGRIITVASIAGVVGMRYTAAYTASKHAAVGLMRAAAAELAGTAVTANAVCPAFVRTDMTERAAATIADRTGRSIDDARRALTELQALGRLIEPEEVAAAVAFLASDEAAPINGQVIVLEGGRIQ